MESFYLSIFLLPLHFFLILMASYTNKNEQVYIAYFGEHSGEKTSQEIEETHYSYLLSVKESEEDAKSSLVYSYKHNINGFAASLTPDEALKLSETKDVVSVFPSHSRSLHTTRSWEFSGLHVPTKSSGPQNLWSMSNYGDGVIIGVIDTGIWPESESFNDIGMGGIPKSWKGKCTESGQSFNSSHCNRKIIGAQYYLKGYEKSNGTLNETQEYRSPRDGNGHGSHTASTVAGRMVNGVAALGGFARGTATGGAPLARLAIYKACWGQGEAYCDDSDSLAAIDDAIADGVHVLSLSIGDSYTRFSLDPLAIGALQAVRNNIIVACSAGNDGPDPGTVVNSAPWVITVGASTVDRKFPSSVELGNGIHIMGESITPYKLLNKAYPLAFGGQLAYSNATEDSARLCRPGSLSPRKAKGKIILCEGLAWLMYKGVEVKRAGGVGLILGYDPFYGDEISLVPNILPAITVSYEKSKEILKYINSTKEPKTKIISAITILDTKPAPVMWLFSSRGPNSIAPDILKPDITAPGVNILAAWSETASPTSISEDHRSVKYNIISGTSMSCPHVAGALALLKAVHPNWTSAALRSALMTSAKQHDNKGNLMTDAHGDPADPFQFGSGHFNPTDAVDPGLVYDASYTDYLLFVCAIGDTNLIPSSFKCPKNPPSPANLNYPSVAIPGLKGIATIKRTVTNVGYRTSVYFLSLTPPRGISVKISPCILSFQKTGQRISFTITVKVENKTKIKDGEYAFGEYSWFDGIHRVYSSIAVSVA